MSSSLLCINGVYADTGEYLFPPLAIDEAADVARRVPPEVANAEDLKIWFDEVTRGRGVRGRPDLSDLPDVGWGLIFATAEPSERVAEIKKELAPLLEKRQDEAGGYYKVCEGETGYQTGMNREQFLRLHRAPLNDLADPEKLPYYLLIVGDPEKIPYEFQQQLDVQYAVGRIGFEDTKDFGRYARSVVQTEKSASKPRHAAFFAPSHPGDLVSDLSSKELALPLAQWTMKKCPSWTVETSIGPEATRDRLGRLLGGTETPALLFTAGHGVCYRMDDDRQMKGQGALVCADWGGPGNPVESSQSFGAQDLCDTANVAGMITFHFACDSAGTSKVVPFHLGKPFQAAKRAFIASLPQRLLTHPEGGALAVIGHVGSAWRSSFHWPGTEGQTQAFEEMIQCLLKGKRVGDAMESFGLRYAGQATEIVDLLREEKDWGMVTENPNLVRYWTAAYDTRNFIVIGDPAVRLAV